MKKALITGITGQDGSYLAELLLAKGYKVYGIIRREAIEDQENKLSNINHIKDRLVLYEGSLSEPLSFYNIFKKITPDECYHLAASSFVDYSFDKEFLIMTYNFNPVWAILSTIKDVKPDCRFFFAGSSEMFGDADVSPQDENTRFNPRSMYGISKLAGSFLVKNYRQKENIFACTGIMYNHESPRRGHQYVTRKITSSAARIRLGIEKKLYLGTLDARRDWGYSPDYVKAMWLMLQGSTPKDYIIATGRLHSVRDCLEIAFSRVGLDYKDFIEVDTRLIRTAEKVPLCGNPELIKKELGWTNTKKFEDIITEMVDSETEKARKQMERK